MDARTSTGVFLFGQFRLDPLRGLFRCDDAGAPVPISLGSRALDVLRVLIERHGDLVSKDEIMAAAWPGIVVSESNLPIEIRAIRRILDYGQAQVSCIQTVAGRGYRFVAPVTIADTNGPLDTDPDIPSIGWPSPAERRPITVLSAEIAGFPASASETDPEAMLVTLAPLCRHCVEIIGHYDGFVANLSGEALIAYFGYPAAHEDDAERAVRTGLTLVDEIAQFLERRAVCRFTSA